MTYTQQINNPVSKKVVFATAVFLKHFYGWISNGDTTYYQSSDEDVTAVRETLPDGSITDLGDPEASQAALDSVSTASEGAWFWDWDNRRLWYKPEATTTPYENFILADINKRLGNFGGEDSTELPFLPVITTMPSLTMRTGQRFDAELGQTGSGSLGMANDQLFMARMDYEPNGRISITEKVETFGGV